MTSSVGSFAHRPIAPLFDDSARFEDGANSHDVHGQAVGPAQAQWPLAPLMSGRQRLLKLGCIQLID
jgi:hypothetical protein